MPSDILDWAEDRQTRKRGSCWRDMQAGQAHCGAAEAHTTPHHRPSTMHMRTHTGQWTKHLDRNKAQMQRSRAACGEAPVNEWLGQQHSAHTILVYS